MCEILCLCLTLSAQSEKLIIIIVKWEFVFSNRFHYSTIRIFRQNCDTGNTKAFSFILLALILFVNNLNAYYRENGVIGSELTINFRESEVYSVLSIDIYRKMTLNLVKAILVTNTSFSTNMISLLVRLTNNRMDFSCIFLLIFLKLPVLGSNRFTSNKFNTRAIYLVTWSCARVVYLELFQEKEWF